MEMDYSTIMSNGRIFPAPYDVVSILYFMEELTLWSPAFPGFFLFLFQCAINGSNFSYARLFL